MQTGYPKDVVLTDGSEIVLRPVGMEDAESLNTFYTGIPLPDRWFMKEDAADSRVIQRWMDNIESGMAFSIVALSDGSIKAHATLLQSLFGSMRHVGRLHVLVAPEFRRKRLGTWMLLDLIRRAMDAGLEKLRSDFVVGVEQAAIKAAYGLDFHKVTVLENYVKDRDGAYHDLQIMVKNLHQEWSDF